VELAYPALLPAIVKVYRVEAAFSVEGAAVVWEWARTANTEKARSSFFIGSLPFLDSEVKAASWDKVSGHFGHSLDDST
jgi:hypothetical protein